MPRGSGRPISAAEGSPRTRARSIEAVGAQPGQRRGWQSGHRRCPVRKQRLSGPEAGIPVAMDPSRPRSRANVGAARHAALSFDLLCQALLVCASRSHVSPARSSVEAHRIEAAQREIRCAAFLISAQLPPADRRRTERAVWERRFASPRPPCGSGDAVVALLQHAQDTIEHLLRTCDASHDEFLASLHVGFALHELECASSSPGGS
jgi:hypothetical protein